VCGSARLNRDPLAGPTPAERQRSNIHYVHLRLSCFECAPGLLEKPVTVEIEDLGTYKFTCDAGHTSRHHLGNPKFEILFEMAFLAFSASYTREAVATLAAAVEEFLRVFINMVLAKHDFDHNPKWYELKPFWKVVDRAEPQRGAFAALYMIEKGAAPPYLDRQSTEFRNKVIHRGYIPKAAEVASYGQKMLEFVIPLYREYASSFPMLFAIGYDLSESLQTNPEPMNASSYYVSAIRHLLLDSSGTPSFEAAVEFAKTQSFLQTTGG
jgi:hypothetical protein